MLFKNSSKNTNQDLKHFMSATYSLWDEFINANIFITGGTGFIGSWLLESFLHANSVYNLNAKITVLSRNPEGFLSKFSHLKYNKNITWIKGDIRTFGLPKSSNFSHIIHGATDASAKLNNNEPLRMFDTIVTGTRKVLELARISGVKKMLLLSSGAVYGQQPADMPKIKECYQGAPDIYSNNSAYAEGKRAAEFMCNVYAKQYGFEVKIARCFAFTGPLLPLDTHFAVGNFIRDCLRGSDIIIKGDGLTYRSYQYIIDLTIWLWTVLVKGENSSPYNVGSDQEISIYNLAQAIASCFKHKINIHVQTDQPATINYLPPRYIPSTQKAMQELNLTNHFSLLDSIAKTIYWNEKNELIY